MFNSFMTGPVVAGLTRHLMTGFGGWLMASGYADAATTETITGGVVAAVGAIWSYQAKRLSAR